MSRFFLFALLLYAALPSRAQTPADDTRVLWIQDAAHSFGSIPQGKPVTYQFILTNQSKDTVTIQHVEASCGCTTPHWSPVPIRPGDSTVLPVTYNAAGEGGFLKSITVFYTNNLHQVLFIKGEVWKTPDTSVPLNTGIQLVKQ